MRKIKDTPDDMRGPVPVVVAAVRGNAGLAFIEQPEIHVYPALQVGLGSAQYADEDGFFEWVDSPPSPVTGKRRDQTAKTARGVRRCRPRPVSV